MQKVNESPSPMWTLATGRTLRRSAPQARLLRVAHGQLWVTRDGSLRAPAEDLMLQAGDSLALACGEAIVLEALGDSGFEWLEPAPRPGHAC
jgi:Protein of unknown function (DUF2917)